MYFTNTPSLNSMEAIMQRPPVGNQRGGGRLRTVRIHSAKRTVLAGSASTTEKRKAAPWRSARCWMSDSPAAQPLFMKPFMRHSPTHDIRRFKDGFHISTTERMMPL